MIIGICGRAGAGKDTLADLLVQHYKFVKVSFADPLKRICAEVFDFTYDQLWGPSSMRNKPDERYPRHWHNWSEDNDPYVCVCCGVKEVGDSQCYLTPRYALQQLGTEWGRNCHPDVWLEHALKTAAKIEQGGYFYSAKSGLRIDHTIDARHVVIPDLRFENEVYRLRGAGARAIRLVRPFESAEAFFGTHISENQLKDIPESVFDSVIVNGGSIEDLHSVMRVTLDEFFAAAPHDEDEAPR